jgi:hypothetical protein
MKTSKTVLISLLSLVCVMTMEGGAEAFHSGGVGPCEACHSMHNSSQGSSITPIANAYLLRQTDASSTCLNCHQRGNDIGPTTFHISTPGNELTPISPPKQLTPGGDFGWIHTYYTWGVGQESKGERHGHNIVAQDFQYYQDSTNLTAPGGAYPSESLACTSCHDPHGQYRRDVNGTITTTGSPIARSGSFASSPDPTVNFSVGVYRLLAGKNYQPKSLTKGFAFVNDPPAAVAPDRSNRSEAVNQTRVAYGTGMSEWCKNCHANMLGHHSTGEAVKLTGATVPTKADTYNQYVRTGDLSGSSLSSYLSLVPFEEGTANYAALKPLATSDVSVVLTGPGPTAQVMCLTCHRAHASGWDGAMRWNTKSTYVAYNGFYAPVTNLEYAQGRTETEALRAYYDRPASKFAMSQDTLCNKCHNGVYP